MPQYWDYDFSEQDWDSARSAGLRNAISGMQGNTSWLGFWQAGATGFGSGFEDSLTGAIRRDSFMEAQERQRLQDEQERQQREAELNAAGVRTGALLEQIPDEFETGFLPRNAFASEAEYADYLSSMQGNITANQQEQEEIIGLGNALRERGIKPTGVKSIDMKQLEAATKPEPQMTPYQRYRMERDMARDEEEAQAEQEQQEQDEYDMREAGRIYTSLTPEEQANLPSPVGFRGSPSELVQQYQTTIRSRPVTAERKRRHDFIMQRLGPEATGDYEQDMRLYQSKASKTGFESSASSTGAGTVRNRQEPPPRPGAEPPRGEKGASENAPLAPNAEKANAHPDAQPKTAYPGNGKTPEQDTVENVRVLNSADFMRVMVNDAKIPPAIANQLLQNPEASDRVRKAWAAAKTDEDREAIIAALKAEFQLSMSRRVMP